MKKQKENEENPVRYLSSVEP